MRKQKKTLTRTGSKRAHVPIRTCVSCRSKKAQKELIRLVLDEDDRVIIDEFQNRDGRGIYLCDDTSCMEKLLKNKGLGRFFRTDKSITPGFEIM